MRTFLLLLSLVFLPLTAQSKEPLKIVILDTGLNLQDPQFKDVLCSTGHRDFTNSGIQDNIGHGTFVASLIREYAGNPKGNYCFVILKFFNRYEDNEENVRTHYMRALYYSTKINSSIINISAGGPNAIPFEYILIRRNPNIKFIVSAGNDGSDLDDNEYAYYPASYKLENIFIIGALNKNGDVLKTSNYGKKVIWELGVFSTQSGTSFATAVYTGKVIHEIFH